MVTLRPGGLAAAKCSAMAFLDPGAFSGSNRTIKCNRLSMSASSMNTSIEAGYFQQKPANPFQSHRRHEQPFLIKSHIAF
jgi:hypothetical protein